MELGSIFEYANSVLGQENEAREQGLKLSRECIRFSANSIRAVHRGDSDESIDLRRKAADTLSRAQGALAPYPRIYNAGFLQDAEKEYTEAAATFALVQGDPLPMPEDLGVDIAPYLNGLGEAAGELRRHVLDLVRTNKLERGEELLGTMDDIYFLLASIDYPSAMTGGLRRTNDMVRGVLERTRGDLTTAIRRDGLERTIKDLEEKLDG
ncbi:MAG: haloacid dehalogenase [Actinobacteria bacterium]|nr:haloacid dehalogenase [Actinomycetota bacterium]MBU4489643.1 haloacid dehalogenase [Actinomycetota bacterium]